MKKILMTAVLASLVPAAAIAGDVHRDYTHVELGYQHTDVKVDSVDGAYLKGSYGWDNGVYVHGKMSREDLYGLDFDRLQVGVGYHHELTNRVDVLGEASWLRYDVQHIGHDDTYSLATGVRASLMNNLEGVAKVGFVDGSDLLPSRWTSTVGVRYAFTDNWSVGAEAEHHSKIDSTAYNVGVRYSF